MLARFNFVGTISIQCKDQAASHVTAVLATTSIIVLGACHRRQIAVAMEIIQGGDHEIVFTGGIRQLLWLQANDLRKFIFA